MKIIVDAFGGDNAPDEVIKGAARAVSELDVDIILTGDKNKIEAAAKKLGYQVNSYARGLKTNKTNTVAVILPSIIHPFFASLAEHCYRSLSKRGYRMLLGITDYNSEIEFDLINMVKQNKVDGIICLSYNPKLKIDANLPFVSIDRYFDTSVPCVCSDNYYGGSLATEKLIEFGCKNLLFLRTSSNVKGEADKRQMGFESACHLNNVPFHSIVVYDNEAVDIRETFWSHIREHIHDGKCDYDGIFCGTDRLAHLTCQKLRSFGLRVPEDIQVIGFDGLTKFGGDEYYVSTIVQPVEQMAETAVNILFDTDRTKIQPLMCLPVLFGYGGTTKLPE